MVAVEVDDTFVSILSSYVSYDQEETHQGTPMLVHALFSRRSSRLHLSLMSAREHAGHCDALATQTTMMMQQRLFDDHLVDDDDATGFRAMCNIPT